VLFRLNMYRASIERRMEARLHLRDVVIMSLFLGVCALALFMILAAVHITNGGIRATDACLASREVVLGELVSDGGALSESQLRLLEERAERLSWYAGLHRIAAAVPSEIHITEIAFESKKRSRGPKKRTGLSIQGRIRAALEEEGVDCAVDFVQRLASDEYLGAHFREVKLADMSWVDSPETDFMGFEVTAELIREPQ